MGSLAPGGGEEISVSEGRALQDTVNTRREGAVGLAGRTTCLRKHGRGFRFIPIFEVMHVLVLVLVWLAGHDTGSIGYTAGESER